MRFDVDRLGRLAGLPDRGRRSLNEAGNRSHHEDRNRDENDHRWGKNQLAETRPSGKDVLAEPGDDELGDPRLGWSLDERQKSGGNKGDDSKTDKGEKDWGWRKGKKSKTDKGEEDELDELNAIQWLGEEDDDADDELLDIDEGMLRREILRMKKERLQENRLRTAIRGEIQGIFAELGLEQDSSWVYGDKQPKNSKKGRVNMGFPGIGFM